MWSRVTSTSPSLLHHTLSAFADASSSWDGFATVMVVVVDGTGFDGIARKMCQEECRVPMSSLLPRRIAGGQPVLHAEDDPQHLHGYPCGYIPSRTCQQRLFAWKPKRSSRFGIAVLVLDPVACQETPCRCSTGMVLYSVRSSIQNLLGGTQWTQQSRRHGYTRRPRGLQTQPSRSYGPRRRRTNHDRPSIR